MHGAHIDDMYLTEMKECTISTTKYYYFLYSKVDKQILHSKHATTVDHCSVSEFSND